LIEVSVVVLTPSTRRVRSGHGPIWEAHMATKVVIRKITYAAVRTLTEMT